jgi:TRAP-type C4-dicarboxylate transport system permease small subunit
VTLAGFVYRCAEWLAWLGGLVLCAVALLVVASVTGRALLGVGLGPIPGDFELVEMLSAIVVFCFLPWCYLKNGHAAVDLMYVHLPRPVQRTVTVASDWLMLLAWTVLTWRLLVALGDEYREAETTFILALPLWWAYALCAVAAMVGCATYATKALVEVGVARAPRGWRAAGAHGEHP